MTTKTQRITYSKGLFIFHSYFQRFRSRVLGSIDFGTVIRKNIMFLGRCGRGYSHYGDRKPREDGIKCKPQDDSDPCPPAMSSLLYSEPYKIAPPTGRLHLQSMNLWGTFPIQAVKRISSIFLSDITHVIF